MERSAILQQFEILFRDLFDEYSGPVNDGLTARDVEQWDSLANVQLVVMAEKAFGVKFTTSEVAGLGNLGDLIDLVQRKRT